MALLKFDIFNFENSQLNYVYSINCLINKMAWKLL